MIIIQTAGFIITKSYEKMMSILKKCNEKMMNIL